MLRIKLKEQELYDEKSGEFTSLGGVELQLEHSLVSLSKWESEYQRPFLSGGQKSTDEIISYIRMMSLGEEIDIQTINRLSPSDIQKIQDHIGSQRTATTFGSSYIEPSVGAGGRSSTVTSELIYYWMVSFGIPFECQFWHLNRLLTLIKICSIKNSDQKKMPKQEVARKYRDLNEQRKRQMGTKG